MLKTKDKVVVIIACYNGQRYWAGLMPLLSQEAYHDFDLQIVVVDNNSTDDSVAYLKKHYSNIKIITSQENLGFVGANNLGYQYAKKHGADNFITWEVATLSAIDVKARMLERVGRAIANSVDAAIIAELATTTNTAAAVQTWDNATESLQQPLKDILTGIAGMAIDNWNAYKNGYIIMHPTNFMELMNNPVCRNAGQFYTSEVTRNGRVGKICGLTIIVNNASTENTVLMCIGQAAMTWYEAKPLTTHVIEKPGIGFTIRAWQVGIPVLINNNAAWKITGC